MSKYIDMHRKGSGGFGSVWMCRRDTDKQIFTKKVLDQQGAKSISRFSREVRLLSQLDHPDIVNVVAKYENLGLTRQSLQGHIPTNTYYPEINGLTYLAPVSFT